MYHKILVPLDGSSLAEKALEPAATLAGLTGAELILFRSLLMPGYTFGTVGAFPVNIKELVDSEREAARKYLEGLVPALEQRGLRTRIMLSEGKPSRAIPQTAETEKVDLVVLASHGHGGLRRWVYGSVAERVLRRCRQNVLLVRTQEGSAE